MTDNPAGLIDQHIKKQKLNKMLVEYPTPVSVDMRYGLFALEQETIVCFSFFHKRAYHQPTKDTITNVGPLTNILTMDANLISSLII